ncbi:hypothetical protein [Dysgonomonas macrotermitis]|uniref:hypothetical protein n=1 Tax=Dysgonomonas macrotermitis TaxID=1346286 RepID=UPI00161983E1|nr:hypothetical protein [Dysgonomonas macrotermitis]
MVVRFVKNNPEARRSNRYQKNAVTRPICQNSVTIGNRAIDINIKYIGINERIDSYFNLYGIKNKNK